MTLFYNFVTFINNFLTIEFIKFIKPNLVQDLTNRPVVSTNITQDLSYNDEKIYGLDELDPENDCQGKWLPWDESNCPDSRDRCTLKFREYKVIRDPQNITIIIKARYKLDDIAISKIIPE